MDVTGEIKEFKDETELQKALRTGDWIHLEKRPDPKCTLCYGRGHLGKNLGTGKYVLCRCVKRRPKKGE